MLFFCKRWLQLFLPLYFGGGLFVWLIVLFELILVKRVLVFSQDVLIFSLFSLGKIHLPVLLLSSALASGLLFAEWEAKKIRLLWNSIGVSTGKMLSWAVLPLGTVMIGALLSLHAGDPFLARKRQEILPIQVAIGHPVSIGDYTLLIKEGASQQYHNIHLINSSVKIEAETGYFDGAYLVLQKGQGVQAGYSVAFEEARIYLPNQQIPLGLSEQPRDYLQQNGGRREKMELIKRTALPLAFPLLSSGVNIVIIHYGHPVRQVLLAVLIWWIVMRAIEVSALPSEYAWIPLLGCTAFFIVSLRFLR
jgi:hypothetical protein